jgi:tRNA uridine 5-carboxymethylaminomethyl modification enzyme
METFRGEEILSDVDRERHRLRSVSKFGMLISAHCRLKPARRIDGRTINWAALQEQPSDDDWTMSPITKSVMFHQFSRAITRTNTAARNQDNLDRSPLFDGAIDAQGPRYCVPPLKTRFTDLLLRFSSRYFWSLKLNILTWYIPMG